MSSSWVSSAQIKVTSEQLSSKAAQVKIKINNIKSKISELEDSVRMTETIWRFQAQVQLSLWKMLTLILLL